MFHHAGHRHGDQTVRLVVFKHVAPLTMQEQHNGLQETKTQTDARLSYNTVALWRDVPFLSLSARFFYFNVISVKTSETTLVLV